MNKVRYLCLYNYSIKSKYFGLIERLIFSYLKLLRSSNLLFLPKTALIQDFFEY